MKARIGLGVGLMALAGAAASQTATTVPRQAPVPASKLPAAPAEQAVPSVNVAAERPSSRIDRQVYDVKNDASASNGTAADALNSVPSVSVAPDGAVQLRGSSNVQILIDGKPSAMLQGEGRGAGLLSIPAEDLDSVEVINNPGAQFGTDGGGGPVINLVMKRIRRPGGSGALNANAGMAGRANAALSGSYNDGAWGYQGSVNVRRDGRDSTVGAVRRRIDPHTGLASLRTQEGSSTGLNDSAGLNATLSYNLGQNDTLGASVNLQRRSNDALGQDHYRNYDAAGMLATDYLSTSQRSGSNRSAALGARWDHKGEAPGELLKFDLRLSRAENPSDSAFRNIPAGAGSERLAATCGRTTTATASATLPATMSGPATVVRSSWATRFRAAAAISPPCMWTSTRRHSRNWSTPRAATVSRWWNPCTRCTAPGKPAWTSAGVCWAACVPSTRTSTSAS
jgi:hypothetical protein